MIFQPTMPPITPEAIQMKSQPSPLAGSSQASINICSTSMVLIKIHFLTHTKNSMGFPIYLVCEGPHVLGKPVLVGEDVEDSCAIGQLYDPGIYEWL